MLRIAEKKIENEPAASTSSSGKNEESKQQAAAELDTKQPEGKTNVVPLTFSKLSSEGEKFSPTTPAALTAATPPPDGLSSTPSLSKSLD